jgi:hypothetical protein
MGLSGLLDPRQSHPDLNLEQLFPFVSIQVMDGCLKALLETTPSKHLLQMPHQAAGAPQVSPTFVD